MMKWNDDLYQILYSIVLDGPTKCDTAWLTVKCYYEVAPEVNESILLIAFVYIVNMLIYCGLFSECRAPMKYFGQIFMPIANIII